AYYDKVIKIRPDVLDSWSAKARIYEMDGKIKEAVKVYEQFYKEYPDNPFVLVHLGRLYNLTNDLEKSEEVLTKAKILLPQDFNTAFWLAMLYERTSRIQESVKELEFVYGLSEHKNNLLIISKLAYFYAALGHFDKAAVYIERGLKISPDNLELLYFAGLNYMDMQKFSKAAETLNKIVNLSPNFPDAYLYLGAAYDRSGNWNAAQDILIKAVMLFPNDARIMNYLGFSYTEKGINLNDALVLLEKAVSLDNQNGQYIDSLGWLYFKLGRLDIAERALVTAANMTRHPQVYAHLGDVYSAMGRNADAWTAYSLSFDGYEDKKVKQKLDKTQSKLSESELADKILFRISSHYLKLFSLKTGFKVKADSFFINKTGAFFNFNYVKGEAIALTFQTPLMPDANIYIKDGKIYFSPKSLEQSLNDDVLFLLKNAADILKGGFIESFSKEYKREGNKIIYANESYKMTVDIKTSLIKEIAKDGLIIEVLDFRRFFASTLPSKIRAQIPSKKLSFILEASSFDYAKEHIVIPK
ncbi:MAG: tetratricopeptide repeat protein, partial [Elusimicrobiota bacterium]|nr:tetratricopeptide repeat protein [Elusimicrobiota bacterium]